MIAKLFENTTQFEVFLSISLTSVGFILFHFITSSHRIKVYFESKFTAPVASVRIVLFQRLLGVLFFGIFPVITVGFLYSIDFYQLGVNINKWSFSAKWLLILTPLILFTNYANSKKEDNLLMYPQFRIQNWDLKILLLSALSWISYLIAYEFMFRGFLLFTCYYAFGSLLSVTINVCIYALVHVPKGIKETIGAIPLGIVVCLFTLKTGNIIFALILHIILALSNEWFSLKAHPGMTIKYKNAI